jgi:hypothetical protein
MADSKRQSIVGKVATPKVGPAKDVIDGDSILYKAVGARYVLLASPVTDLELTSSQHQNYMRSP